MSKTIHLKLRKGKNKIFLRQLNLNTQYSVEITVLRCFVAWSLKNIRYGLNDAIVVKGAAVQLPQGYYNFSDLKELLKKHKITIDKLKDNHVELTAEEDSNLKSFGSLLGFDENKAITKNTKYKSTVSASLTNRLKDIHIHCSLVDPQKNISYNNNLEYYQSDLLMVLSIDSTQPLNGNFTNYPTEGLHLPCRDYNGQEIVFDVESGATSEDYEIYLTLKVI